jgi:hypothetical protein
MDILHIGVTGHRILAPDHGLEAGILKVIDAIDRAFPEKRWIVNSSLAEGADCLFVQYALQRPEVYLFVPLPLPEDEYLLGFRSDESRSIFRHLYQHAFEKILLARQPSHEEAFRSAGEYIVEHSDLLVAVWDGKKEQGVGGTGFVVQLARQRNLPLARIIAGNRRTGTFFPTHMGEKQGVVLLERFPLHDGE